MSDHRHEHHEHHAGRTIERHCDVAVIGGSAAGLAAALQLGRQHRSVIVVDAGEPRNAPATHLHGHLGHEGREPSEFLTIERDEVRSYGGEVVAGMALDVTRTDDDGFRVQLSGGHTIVARRVLAATGLVATGLVDELPDIDGLAGGELIDTHAVMVGTSFRVRTEPFSTLGLGTAPHASGLGDVVQVDATGATNVPGLYAAGNVTDPSHQLLQAAANGSWAGAMIAFSLTNEDVAAAARPSANETDWDHRYSGDQLWSGNPNGTLVKEISGVTPGRALDIGAGEGGDAVWLAEQGWQVTANDISQRALDRVAAEAERRGLHIERNRADANAFEPFPAAAFDLVTAHYASIPRTPDGRGVRNLLDAVVPGGTLLVVSHDLEPMRAPIDTRLQSRPFDPDGYVRVEDFVAALDRAAGWDIEVNETRPRPTGAVSTHHVDDVVLRARRHAG